MSAISRKKYEDFYGEALDYIEDQHSWNLDYLASGLAALMLSAVNPLFVPAVLILGAARIVAKIERKAELEKEVLEMEMGYKPKSLVPFLPPDKQKDYQKAVGSEAYQEERERAIEAGLGVPPLPEAASTSALPADSVSAIALTESAFVFKGQLVPTLAEQIHLLISATTGSGKSTILQALARHLTAKGDKVIITDPKMEQWGEDLQSKVIWPESGADVVEIIKTMEMDFQVRQKTEEKPKHDVWWFFDEWFLLRSFCSTLPAPEIAAMEMRIIKVIAAGRSLGIHLVIVNQSHYLKDLSLRPNGNSFSTGLRSNIATLGLGAEWTLDGNQQKIAAKYDSIELMLKDDSLIPNNDARDLGRRFFSELRNRPDVNRTFMLAAGSVYIHPTPDMAPASTQTVNVAAVASPTKAEIDWAEKVPHLLAQDGGARQAFAKVFQNDALARGGPPWQELRNKLMAEFPNLDPELVAKLRAKFPSVF